MQSVLRDFAIVFCVQFVVYLLIGFEPNIALAVAAISAGATMVVTYLVFLAFNNWNTRYILPPRQDDDYN